MLKSVMDERYPPEDLRQLARVLPGKRVRFSSEKYLKIGRVVAAEYVEGEGVRVTLDVEGARWRGMVGLPE